MYGQESFFDPFFMALYGGTALLTLVAALYLLLRRSNAIAPDVRSSRVLRRWCLLAVASAAVAVYWGIDLWHHNFDIYYRIFTLFLEAVFVFIMVDSTVSAVSIAQSSPVGSSLDRISHKANAAEPSKFKLQNSRFDLSRPVNIGIAASVTLVMVACATSVGDGYTMSQDHNARIEAVENVQSILNNI